MFKNHPKALPYLFFSEMWERFGYYLMIGIFTFYLKNEVEGFSLNEKESANLYGTFIALVFFTPFIGGLIADRILGYTKSIIIGGILMGVGYCMMYFHNINTLYISMAFVIIGNGFFKPNISTLLGNLYNEEQYKDDKDQGYNIFYMGINIGAFICNFFSTAISFMYGYKWAFVAAGVGMFVGVFIFIIGIKHFKHADIKKEPSKDDMSLLQIILILILPAIFFGVIGFKFPIEKIGDAASNAFIFACIPVIAFFGFILFKAKEEEKKPISVLLAIFAVVILFWAVFKQNGSALNTWAEKYTERTVSGGSKDFFSALKLTKEIKYNNDSAWKTDEQFRTLKNELGEKIKELKTNDYFKNLVSEKIPKEGGSVTVWGPSLSQSINPGWVILLTPLVIAFFSFLRLRKKEPTTITKIALGLFISGLSALVMVAAVKVGGNGAEKVSMWWLIGTYGVITIGELMLSPMGLSLVNKLSPKKISALMMGGWFLATSIGNKLSGILASLWDSFDDKSHLFWMNFSLLMLATLIMLFLLKWANKVFK